MAAGKYNFTVEQGTTTTFNLKCTDSNGDLLDLTGYSAKLQVRPDYADLTETVYLTLSSSLDMDGSGISISPESGSLSLYISANKTDGLTFDEAIYDLEIYSGSHTTRLIEGKFKIKKSVTR